MTLPSFLKGGYMAENMLETYKLKVTALDGTFLRYIRVPFLSMPKPSVVGQYFRSTENMGDAVTQCYAQTGIQVFGNMGMPNSHLRPDISENEAWNNVSWFGFFGNRSFYVDLTANQEKWIFPNGSYIIVGPSQYIQSENYGRLPLKYYTKNDALVIDTNINVQPYNNNKSIEVKAFPWKGYSDANYYNFVEFYATGSPTSCSFHWGASSAVSKARGEQFFQDLIPEDPDDPFPDIDPNDGDDDIDPDGIPDPDPIPFPDDPDISVLDAGFITLFAPTQSQVQNLASYMWSGLFDLNTFKKIFADPMDCILGFNVLPFQVPRSGISSVTVGNISTGVEMYKAYKQWVTIDCGSLDIGAVYDTYLDYAPYTKWSIYLPFIGLQQLSTDDVAHKTLSLKYKVDILSCSCVAYLMCGDQVLYQYSGSCGYPIPVTSDNFARLISNVISIASTAGTLIASGGVTAPMAVSAGASLANNVMGLKPDVKRGGSIGSSAGLLGIQTPYIIIEVPNLCKPEKQQRYLGYPSFITKSVGSVSGYVEYESIILSGVTCTDSERAQIEEILKGGCYV